MGKIRFSLILFVLATCVTPAFASTTNQTQNDAVSTADKITMEQFSSDGTVKIQIQSNLPKTGNALSISIRFLDASTNKPINNVNYDIVAMQNGEIVLSEIGAFAENGAKTHMTSSLGWDSQVEVMVVLQGIGENLPFEGPIGETIEVKIVPEFGNIVAMILALAIISGITLPKIIYKTR